MARKIGKVVSSVELEKLIKQDYTIKQMSACLRIGPTAVRYWLKKHDLRTRRGPAGKHPKDLSLPRKCPCGERNPQQFYGNKRKLCVACHNKDRYRRAEEIKQRVVDVLGGSCKVCGYKKCLAALHIHHRDPRKKDVAFRGFKYWGWERVKKEIRGCILLCANHHAEAHNDQG